MHWQAGKKSGDMNGLAEDPDATTLEGSGACGAGGGGAGRGEPAQAMVLVLHVWHCCTQPCLYSFSSLYVHVSASRHFGRPGESCK